MVASGHPHPAKQSAVAEGLGDRAAATAARLRAAELAATAR
ncbi:UNVERIFIED_ORG: hypothetical protein FHR35_007109 [Microbispora rosea subsp. rosea]